MVEKRGRQYLSDNMPLMHADLHDMPRPEAAKLFIRELSAPPTAHNTHLYKLKRSKHEPLGTAWLGICPRGIEIYEVSTPVYIAAVMTCDASTFAVVACDASTFAVMTCDVRTFAVVACGEICCCYFCRTTTASSTCCRRSCGPA